jgi:hypothetical protein
MTFEEEIQSQFAEDEGRFFSRRDAEQLRARWTYEAQQDLRAFHNLNVEAELTDILASEMQREIDVEVVRDIRNNNQSLYDAFHYLDDYLDHSDSEMVTISLTQRYSSCHKRMPVPDRANWRKEGF